MKSVISLLLSIFITFNNGYELCTQLNTFCSKGTVVKNLFERNSRNCHIKCRQEPRCTSSQYVLADKLCILYEKCSETIPNPLQYRTTLTDVNCPIENKEDLIRGRCGSAELKIKEISNSSLAKTKSWGDCRKICEDESDRKCTWFSYHTFTKNCFRYSKCNYWIDDLASDYVNGHQFSYQGDADSYIVYGVDGIIAINLDPIQANIRDCPIISPQLFYGVDQPYVNIDHFDGAVFLNHVNYPTVCGTLDNGIESDCAILYPDKEGDNTFKWKYFRRALDHAHHGSASSYVHGRGWWITGGSGFDKQGSNATSLINFKDLKEQKIQKEDGPILPRVLKNHCQIHIQKWEEGKYDNDGITYVIGGDKYFESEFIQSRYTYSYTWSQNHWRTLEDFPTNPNDIQCINVDNNKILAIVSTYPADPYSSYIYNVELGTWSKGPPLERGPIQRAKLNTLFKNSKDEVLALMAYKLDGQDAMGFYKFEEDKWTPYGGNHFLTVGLNSDHKYGIHPISYLQCNKDYGLYTRRN